MATSVTIPTVLSIAGAQPTPPSTLNAELIAIAQTLSPGLTASLPASLIEDLSSTATGAVSLCDQAYVELLNSVTPYGANAFILNQLGIMYGIQPGAASNTSVYVQFTGTPGFVISKGFIVSDGTYQYVIQDGGIIGAAPPGGTNGLSAQLFAVATVSGSWAVPVGTVTTISTSVPTSIQLAVTNPVTGTPSEAAETTEQYRARVLEAGQASAQGMPTFLKTQLAKVPGVLNRLISLQQVVGGGWLIMCAGGDPYLMAYAVYQGLFDINQLLPSQLKVTGITNANPGVMTTDLTHGYSTGQVINVTGVVGMTGINNTPLTVTVLTPNSFSIGKNTTSSGSYISGGIVTPNLRNQLVSINDFPDVYSIPLVIPFFQFTTVAITWNTIATNVVSASAIASLAGQPIVNYVNSIAVGQPLNVFELQTVFLASIATLVQPSQISVINIIVTVNGIELSPLSGTGLIYGDPQSYFETTLGQVSVTQQ